MSVTPEIQAEIDAWRKQRRERKRREATLAQLAATLPKPKCVTSDGVVIRDADVVLSKDDIGALRRESEVVAVRKPDPEWLRPDPRVVTINMELYTQQRFEREAAEAQAAQFRNALAEADPMGVWSTSND
jgi:hypothetical protein